MAGMSEAKKALRALENFHLLMPRTSFESGNVPGVSESLQYLRRMVGKVRTLAEENRERRIGVFGPPKRGKSTLLNVFLGDHVLPCGITPVTHCAVELHNIAGSEERPRVVVHRSDGTVAFEHDVQSLEGFCQEISRCFRRSKDVEKIEVYGDFSAGIALERSVLVDTPGAEAAFEEEQHEDAMGVRGEELHRDTRIALDMLEKVDIPLFCMRATGLGSESERRFYREYMQKIRPINIVNFIDSIEGEEFHESEMRYEVAEKYDVSGRDTVFLSAKQGLDIMKKYGSYGEIEKNLEWDRWGIDKLALAIKDRLAAMEPGEALRRFFEEYSVMLKRHGQSSPNLLPRKLFLLRFQESLEGFSEAPEIRRNLERQPWLREC